MRTATLVVVTLAALILAPSGQKSVESTTIPVTVDLTTIDTASGETATETIPEVVATSPQRVESIPLMVLPDELIPGWAYGWEGEIDFAQKTELSIAAVRIADMVSPFRWRDHTSIRIVECYDCEWVGRAVYYTDGSIEVDMTPEAFSYGETFALTVMAHELAHVWQYATGRDSSVLFDGFIGGLAAAELEADCIAAGWGWPEQFYWDCPEEYLNDAAAAYAANPLE